MFWMSNLHNKCIIISIVKYVNITFGNVSFLALKLYSNIDCFSYYTCSESIFIDFWWWCGRLNNFSTDLLFWTRLATITNPQPWVNSINMTDSALTATRHNQYSRVGEVVETWKCLDLVAHYFIFASTVAYTDKSNACHQSACSCGHSDWMESVLYMLRDIRVVAAVWKTKHKKKEAFADILQNVSISHQLPSSNHSTLCCRAAGCWCSSGIPPCVLRRCFLAVSQPMAEWDVHACIHFSPGTFHITQ